MNEETITKELTRFNITDTAIAKLRTDYMKLKITDISDQKGYALVHHARMDIRDRRVAVTKQGKAIREDALAFQKMVLTEEKRILALLEPIEEHLMSQEKAVDDALLEIKLAKARAEEAKIQKRVDALYALGMRFDGVNYVVLEMGIAHKSMAAWTDDQFKIMYEKVKTATENENKRLAEEAAAAKKAYLEAARIEAEEKQRLAKQKIEQEKEAKRLEAERQTLEDRRRAVEKLENARNIEKAKKEAAKQAEKETKERMKREYEAKAAKEKEEAERKKAKEEHEAAAKAEEARIAAEMAPDKVKLVEWTNQLRTVKPPSMKTRKMQNVVDMAMGELKTTVAYILKEAK